MGPLQDRRRVAAVSRSWRWSGSQPARSDRDRLRVRPAQRVPGSRDVINGIAVDPPKNDSNDAIQEAVRLVLEKGPFVDASQLGVVVKHALVRLTGVASSEAEREMAEFDGWYVFGVQRQ
jgi:osmotically-inducible protein OsmY